MIMSLIVLGKEKQQELGATCRIATGSKEQANCDRVKPGNSVIT